MDEDAGGGCSGDGGGRYYGVSRKIFYKWQGRYRQSGRDFHLLRDRSRPRRKPRSYAMAVPGQRVQIDVKYLPPLKQYLCNAIDDCTRLQAAPVSSELTPKASRRFLRPVKRSFPFPIQEVQTDHGTEFTHVFFPHVRKPHPGG